jgi:hypothetical protein
MVSGPLSEVHAYWVSEIVRLGLLSEAEALKWFDAIREKGRAIDEEIRGKQAALARAEYGSKELKKGIEDQIEQLEARKNDHVWDDIQVLKGADPAIAQKLLEEPYDAIPLMAVSVPNADSPLHNAFYAVLRARAQDAGLWNRFFSRANYNLNADQRAADATYFSKSLTYIIEQKTGARLASQANEEVDRFRKKIHQDITSLAELTSAVEDILNRIWQRIGLDHPNISFDDADVVTLANLRSKLLQYHPLVVLSLRVMPQDRIVTFNFVDLKYVNSKIGMIANDLIIAKRHSLIRSAMQRHRLIGSNDEPLFDTYKQDKYVISRVVAERLGVGQLEAELKQVREEVLADLAEFAVNIYAEQLKDYQFKMFAGVSSPVSSNFDESKIYADLQSGQAAKEARRIFEASEASSGVFVYDTYGNQEANSLIEARAAEAAQLRSELGLSNDIAGDKFDMPADEEMMEVRGKSERQIQAMGDSRKMTLKKYLDLIDYFDYPKGWIDEEITQRNKQHIITRISEQISRAIQNRAPPLSPEQSPATDPDTSFTLLMRQALSVLSTNLKQSNITSETVFHEESMRRRGIFVSYDAADFYTNTMRQMAKAHLLYLRDIQRTPMSLLDHTLKADDNVKRMMIDKTAHLIRLVNKGTDARLRIPTLSVIGLQRPRAKNRAYLATREGGDEAGVFVEFKEGDITEKELESWLSNLVRDGRALNGRLTVSERWDGQSKNYASVVAETVHPYSERYVAAQAAELYLKRLMVQSGSVSKTALIQVLENNQGAPTKWKFFYTGADGAVQIETQTYEDLIKGSRLSLKTDGRIYQEWIGSNPVLAAAILKADALIDTDQQIMVELDVVGQVEGKPKPYVHILQYQGLITNLVLGPTNAEDRSEALRGPVAEKLIHSIFSWLKAKGFTRLQLALLSDRIENSKKFFNSTLAPFAEAEDAYLFQKIGGTTYLVADLSKFDFSAGGRLSSNAVRRGIPTAARKAFAKYLNDPYDAMHLLSDDLIAINGMPGLRDGAGITQEQFFDMAMQRKVSVKSALTRLKQGHGSVIALPVTPNNLISLIDSPVERNLEFYKKGEQMLLIVSPGQPTTDHDFAYGLDRGSSAGAAFNSPFLKFIHIEGHSHPRYSKSEPSDADLEGDAGKLSEFSFGSLIVTKIDAETIDLERRRPEGRDYKNYRGESAVGQLEALGILKSTDNTGARLADTIESVRSLTMAETEKIRRTLVPDSSYRTHWMNAAEVPWIEVVRDPMAEPKPLTQNQDNYWVNQHKIRLEFLRYLASAQAKDSLNEDDFSQTLLSMNKILLLGSSKETPYITPTSVEPANMDAYQRTAARFRGDKAATDIFKAFSLYVKLKENKASQMEIIQSIAGIYRSAIITNLQPFYHGNNSLIMNIVNALLRLEGLNGISHGRFDSVGNESGFESDYLSAIKLANPGLVLPDASLGARLADSAQDSRTPSSKLRIDGEERSLFLNEARLSGEHISSKSQIDVTSLSLLAQVYQNRGRLAGSVFHFGISESRFATVQFAPGGFAAVSLVGLPGAPMIELPAPDNVLAPKMREAESTASIIVKTAINDNASIARTGFRVLTSLGERPVLIVRPVSGVEEALQIKETLDVIAKRLPQVYFEFYDANSGARLAQLSSAAGSIPAEAQIVYLAEANEVNLRSALDRKARFVSTEPIDQKNGDMAFLPLTASLTAAAVVGRLDSIQGQDLAAQFFRRLTKATFGQTQYQFYIKPSIETLPDLAFNSIKALARLEIAQVLAGARMALQAIAQAA